MALRITNLYSYTPIGIRPVRIPEYTSINFYKGFLEFFKYLKFVERGEKPKIQVMNEIVNKINKLLRIYECIECIKKGEEYYYIVDCIHPIHTNNMFELFGVNELFTCFQKGRLIISDSIQIDSSDKLVESFNLFNDVFACIRCVLDYY